MSTLNEDLIQSCGEVIFESKMWRPKPCLAKINKELSSSKQDDNCDWTVSLRLSNQPAVQAILPADCIISCYYGKSHANYMQTEWKVLHFLVPKSGPQSQLDMHLNTHLQAQMHTQWSGGFWEMTQKLLLLTRCSISDSKPSKMKWNIRYEFDLWISIRFSV